MESTPSMPGRAPRWVRVLQVVVALLVLAFCVSTVPGVRSGTGFDVWWDGWVQGGCYVLLAAVIVLRAVRPGAQARLWRLLAAAVVARALGFVLALAWIRRLADPPYPSPADFLWVLSSLLLLVVLVLRVRQFAPRQSLLVVLDALTGSVATTALAVFALDHSLGTFARAAAPSPELVVNLVYPALDVALLVVAATAVSTSWSRLIRADLAVIGGIVGFAVVDVAYVVRLADGSWHPGSPVSALSLLATMVIAYAAWVPAGRLIAPEPDPWHEPSIVPTAVFGLVCVGVFVVDDIVPTPTATVVLTALALVTALVRGVLTLSEARRHSARIIGATTEELLRFQALVESSSDFIAIATPLESVLYVNPGGRRLVGLSADHDVTAMSIRDFLPPERRDIWRQQRQPRVIGQGVWDGRSLLTHHGGEAPIPVAVSTFVIPDPDTGRPLAIATVQRDERVRIAAENSVRDLQVQREQLLTRLVQAQDDERTRIAADVHDDSVQALAAVELRLGALERRLAQAAPELLEPLATVSETVAGATARLRHLLFDLESPARDQQLVPALAEAAAFVLEESDLRWQVLADDRLPDLPETTRVTAYRIAKEALVNAREHSGARTVVIEVGADDAELVLTVRDDGRGLPPDGPEDRPGHLGLAAVRDRAAMAGGRVELRNVSGGGAQLTLWLPLPALPAPPTVSEPHPGRVGDTGVVPPR